MKLKLETDITLSMLMFLMFELVNSRVLFIYIKNSPL